MNFLKKIIEWLERHKKFSFTILIVILGIMTYLSSISGGNVFLKSNWLSGAYHFSIFAAFAFFFLAVINKSKIKPRTILTTAIVSLLASILDELHQLFVPLRSASIQDVLTDSTGILFSMILYILIKKTK